MIAAQGNVTYRNSRTMRPTHKSDGKWDQTHTITKAQYDQLRNTRRAVGMGTDDNSELSTGSSC